MRLVRGVDWCTLKSNEASFHQLLHAPVCCCNSIRQLLQRLEDPGLIGCGRTAPCCLCQIRHKRLQAEQHLQSVQTSCSGLCLNLC